MTERLHRADKDPNRYRKGFHKFLSALAFTALGVGASTIFVDVITTHDKTAVTKADTKAGQIVSEADKIVSPFNSIDIAHCLDLANYNLSIQQPIKSKTTAIKPHESTTILSNTPTTGKPTSSSTAVKPSCYKLDNALETTHNAINAVINAKGDLENVTENRNAYIFGLPIAADTILVLAGLRMRSVYRNRRNRKIRDPNFN